MMNRTMLLGRLAEERNKLETLKIEIHAAVAAILTHFDPVDQDLQYVSNIKPDQLKVHIQTIERKKKLFDKVEEEIKHLEGELGER